MPEPDLTERATTQFIEGPTEQRTGPILRTRLHNTLMLPRGRDHLPALPDVMRERLLDVDILPCLAGPNCGQAMPMIGRGDHDRVHVSVIEHPPQIPVRRNVMAPLLERLGLATKESLIHVAQRRDPD